MSVEHVFKTIEENNIMFVDFRFIGLNGGVHHITLPVSEVSEETFEAGVAFDGSSIPGFRNLVCATCCVVSKANVSGCHAGWGPSGNGRLWS